MPTTPKSNLPPEAQPWGRSVEDRIADLERALGQSGDTSLMNNKAINGTLTQLSNQVAAIAQVQADQAAQLAAINALIATTVKVESFAFSYGPITLGSTQVNVASGIVPVPAGYTAASVMAVAHGTSTLTSVGTGIQVSASITSSAGSNNTYIMSNSNATASNIASATVGARHSGTGLTPGSNISIAMQSWYAGAGASNAYGTISGIVIFTR